ncbi:MAG: hypothetical protein OSB00_18305, partial [Sphingomonas bacterium]|nr:hypothetical protein [Sphingomonas bacterium]
VISTSDDEFRSGSMIFGETIPKGYTYGVLPSVRGMSVKGSELGSFQLRFIATDNPCQRNS